MVEVTGGAAYAFHVDGLSSRLEVVGFEGEEAISELFELRVTLSCAEEALAFADVVGLPATLTLRGGREPRFVHGIVSRFEQGEDGEPLTTYHATLVPSVYRLLLRRTSRIFQQRSVPEIVLDVLAEAGLPESAYRLELHEAYPPREHTIQYRESDWAFVSRLLESEGIFYFFEQREDGCLLVIADTLYAHHPIVGEAKVPFHGSRGALAGGEHLARFRYAEQLRPGRVTMRGYSFQHPQLPLASEQRVPGDAALAIYQHDDFDEPKHAPALVDRRARVALEIEQVTRRLVDGGGTSTRFAAGATFTLAEHPRDAFNGDWLITRVTHHGGGPGVGYKNRFTCIPADVVFRPTQSTPRPTALGVQTAKVVGPPGEEIYTDAFGRVKVQFHWDREGQWDERSSCWIRVSQAWAGSGWGSLFVPRVGSEVVVDFVEGDLDHPLILGGVYHGTNVPPYGLPADRTASTLKSSSTPGGGGSNELRLEDRTGAERIYVHAERDLTVDVDRDHSTSVGNDETLRVGNDRDKTVDGDEREIIGHDRSIEVGGQHVERIAGDESITVEGESEKIVGASLTESVGANRTLSVGGTQTEVIGAGLSILVRGEKSESIEAASAETVSTDKTSTVGGDLRVSVAGTTATTATTAEEEISGSKTIRVGTRFELIAGQSRIVVERSGKIVIEGPEVEIRSSGPVKVQGDKLQVKSSGAVQVTAATRVDFKGRRIEIN